MAEQEKTVVEKAGKDDKKTAKAPKKDKPGIFAKLAKLLREFRSEFKKVVWPALPQTAKNTVVVLVVLVISAVAVGLIDYAFSMGLNGLASLV